jgi:hypothetical protein
MAIELTREAVNAAKLILSHPVINEIFTELETSAINGAMQAGPVEHEIRYALLCEAKAIRSLRSKLLTLKAREASLNDEGA